MSLQHKEILSRYFPAETVEQVSFMLLKYSVQLKISRERTTKLGDYRPPGRLSKHRITINGNLEKYFFYLVFLHEMAHLLVWNKYNNKVSPHGRQWKEEFGSLLQQAIFNKMLPPSLIKPVHDFSSKVKATFSGDAILWKELKMLDGRHDKEITIAEIPPDTVFLATNGNMFRKEEKLRKRFRCYCLTNKRRYLFHPMAVVVPMEIPDKKSSKLET